MIETSRSTPLPGLATHRRQRGLTQRQLVQLQDRFRLMGYSTRHENSYLRTSVVGRGARKPPGGAALQRRFHHAPIADAPRQFQGRARPEDRLEARMRLANGARCHPRLQPEGPSLPRGRVLAPQEDPRRLRPTKLPSLAGDAPPLPEGVRIRVEPLDFGYGRRCGLRGGTDRDSSLGGDDPGYALAPAFGEVDASEAVDHLPRSLVRKKKEGATD
jgi:hypothetical protein